MNLHQTTKYIMYHVNEDDKDRICNANKELIGKNTFQHGFRPQVPDKCIRLM